MKKKQTIHFFEVYIKLETQEIPILRTTKMSAAKKAYQRTRNARLRIDGNEQPIIAADKLMRCSYGRDVIIPKYQPPIKLDNHYLKPAE